jgi:hypothetical protein
MTDTVKEFGGVRALVCAPDGPTVQEPQHATDIIGEALGAAVELVVLPVERLGADFFTLSSRLAGEVLQKFVNYRLQLAVVGDMSAPVDGSTAWRDLIRESNRGRHAWFVADLRELGARLSPDL